VSNWIKATTPPDSDREVLIAPCKRGQVGLGRYQRNAEGEGWWIDREEELWDEGRSGSEIISGVRYWMPLPEAPAGTPPCDDTVYEAYFPDLSKVRGILK
jgi:hypothetical protein